MPDFVYNATYKFSNYFRHFYGQYASDNQVNVHNPENKITFESVYHPLAGYYDFWFYKPHSNTFYHGVQIHPAAAVFFPKRMSIPRSVLAAPGTLHHYFSFFYFISFIIIYFVLNRRLLDRL